MSTTPINPAPASALSGVFIQTVATMSGGKVCAKLEDALREATKAALEAGSKAKISVEFTITPNGLGAGDTPLFKLDAKVKRTLPEKPEQSSVYFADDEFNLTRRNPRQEEMRLEAIDGGKITKADIGAGQAAAKAAGS